MKTLLSRLKNDNAVVSIVGDHLGSQNVTTAFFGGKAHFAIGSPSLAWKAGSTLLPVFTVQEAPGRHRIVIDEPIEPHRHLDRKVFVRAAVEEFSLRMQKAIRLYPGSWADWGAFWGGGSIYREFPPHAS